MKRVLDVYFAWAQNVTFFKKLRFGLSQTHFIANFFIYARFGLQKVQTNAHLDTQHKLLNLFNSYLFSNRRF